MFLKQSTASQTVEVGPFLDDTDFKTAETALSIANTDIKLRKAGGTTHGNKNSGGATHIANGYYYLTLDATDTDTVGVLDIHVNATGALAVWTRFYVLEEAVYDALMAASALGYVANAPVNVAQFGGAAGTFAGGRPEVNTSHIAGAAVSTASAQVGVNVVNAGGTAWGSGAITAAVFAAGALDAVWSVATRTLTSISDSAGVTTLLGKLSGITSVAEWLGLIAGKQVGNTTARTELRATGAGAGTYDETTDSQEALRDRGDAAWLTATGFSTLDAAGVRAAVGLASANLDTQLSAIAGYIDTEIGTLLSDVAAILVDTGTTLDDLVDDLETRLTAALADKLTKHAAGVLAVVVGIGSTTTTVKLSTVEGAAPSATDDFYNGAVLVITSGTLAGQRTDITDYVGATTTATVTALTGAPATGVTAIIV